MKKSIFPLNEEDPWALFAVLIMDMLKRTNLIHFQGVGGRKRELWTWWTIKLALLFLEHFGSVHSSKWSESSTEHIFGSSRGGSFWSEEGDRTHGEFTQRNRKFNYRAFRLEKLSETFQKQRILLSALCCATFASPVIISDGWTLEEVKSFLQKNDRKNKANSHLNSDSPFITGQPV